MSEAYQLLMTFSINYQWWCFRCQAYHLTPYCPFDEQQEITSDYYRDNHTYKTCPHCGQEIKK